MHKLVNLLTTSGWNSWADYYKPGISEQVSWLLDWSAGIGATHVAIPTELRGCTDRITGDLIGQIRERKMREVLWISKWYATSPLLPYGLSYLTDMAHVYPDAWFDIGREADALVDMHGKGWSEVLGSLWSLKMCLIDLGIDPTHILAGGYRANGALMIDRIGPGYVTISAYDWPRVAQTTGRSLRETTIEQLTMLRQGADPAHRLWVTEVGWPSSRGKDEQAVVLHDTLLGIEDCKSFVDGVGLWVPVDFLDCGDSRGYDRCTPEAVSYGLLGAGGLPKPAHAAFAGIWGRL